MPGPKRAKQAAIVRGVLVALLMVVLFAAGTIAGIVAAYARNLPDIGRMADYQPASSTRIFARDGSLLASVYKENRVWVPIARIPPLVRDAFIANEDHNFYSHHGVDFGGIVRAGYADLTHQEFQGASTITQQLARRLFLTNEVSISRKVQEALLAMEIERFYTKDEILERYLNIIYLGAGAYGVNAAAHTYFGQPVEKLTLAQAAMLAGVVAAPSDYSPFTNLDLARNRERHVLERMVESGYVSRQQADDAYAEPLGLIAARATGLQGYGYPYFTTYAIAQLQRTFGKTAVEKAACRCIPPWIRVCSASPKMRSLGASDKRWAKASTRIRRRSSHCARRPARSSQWSAAPAFRWPISSIARGRRVGSRGLRSKPTCTRPRSTRECRHRRRSTIRPSATRWATGRAGRRTTTTAVIWEPSRCARP